MWFGASSPGPCLTLFCLAEQTAAGQEEEEDWGDGGGIGDGGGGGVGLVDSLKQAGWPTRQSYERESLFLFSRAVRMGAAAVVWWGGQKGEVDCTGPPS